MNTVYLQCLPQFPLSCPRIFTVVAVLCSLNCSGLLVVQSELLWVTGCAVWIALGYWLCRLNCSGLLVGNRSARCLRHPQNLSHYPPKCRKQPATQRKVMENLVYWSCWKVSIACGKMSHWWDFTIALILNFLWWKHNPVLTKIFSRGWTCLWLSDVSHSLCRKLAFLTPVIMVLAKKLLEKCWYLVDLFFFPAAHKKQTQKYLFFFPLSLKSWLE